MLRHLLLPLAVAESAAVAQGFLVAAGPESLAPHPTASGSTHPGSAGQSGQSAPAPLLSQATQAA